MSYNVTVVMSGAGQDYTGKYNVKKYGAIGDGVANDTLAIQAAIDAAVLASGGSIYFPAGEYDVDALTVIGDNISFEGDSEDSTRFGFFDGGALLGGTNGLTTMTVTGDNFSMRNISIANGPAIDIGALTDPPAGSGRVMRVEGSTGIKMENVTFSECGGTGGFSCRDTHDINITACTFKNITKSGCFIGDTCSDIKVTNSTFKDVMGITPGVTRYLFSTGAESVTIPGTTLYFVKRLLVDGCTFKNNPSWEGLDSHGGEDITYTNNHITNCRTGIAVANASASTPAQFVDDPQLRRLLIKSNIIERGAAATSLYGITVSGNLLLGGDFNTGQIVVSDNVIKGHGGDASVFAGCLRFRRLNDAKIFNNHVEDFSDIGLQLYENLFNLDIRGNTFKNANPLSTKPTETSCVCLTGGDVTNVNITGNLFINSNDTITSWFDNPSSGVDGVNVYRNKFIHTGAVEPVVNRGSTSGIQYWRFGKFDVVDFGADGSNITDDTAAIARAIAFAEYFTNGTVYFPDGLYSHTAVSTSAITVLLDGPGLPKDIAGGRARRMSGAGSPEGVVTAPIGSQWLRTGGGPGTCLYIKETAPTPDTGWVNK